MKIAKEKKGRNLSIFLSGELDHHSAKEAIREVEQMIETELPMYLVLDFSGVSFMDSSGIALVIKMHRRMREQGGNLCIQSAKPQPLKVFEAAGIQRLVRIQ